jgi:hypothetical protein
MLVLSSNENESGRRIPVKKKKEGISQKKDLKTSFPLRISISDSSDIIVDVASLLL